VTAKRKFKLDPAWSVPQAVRQVVHDSLTRLQAGERGVLATDDGKFVHRTRVALRRIRSALKLLGRTDEPASALRAGLKGVARALADARDWDVLLEHALPPIIVSGFGKEAEAGRILSEARRRRGEAHAWAREALSSLRYRALVTELARWLALPAVPGEGSAMLKKFAARNIRKRHKRLLRDGSDLAGQAPMRRHRLRIDAKQLRYTVEFFESLFDGAPARAYLHELVALQDALGAINDGETIARLLACLRPSAEFADFTRERLAENEKMDVAAAQGALARLDECERFWRSKSRGDRKG
jgi:CHAD domain-containing protein